MLGRVKDAHPDLARVADGPHHTAKAWRVPGYSGQLGFISSMSNHFCSSCNRLRLTADGNLKVCLFGAKEVSLRDLMRNGQTDEEIIPVIARAVGNKAAAHAGMLNLAQMENRPMILIGG
jgi:molybdenum cofactor biosynthesis enzyme MoaA